MKFSRDLLEKALQRKIFSWVDGVMKELLPDDIYSMMHKGTVSERLRGSRWLQERGYRVVSLPDGVVQIFQGTTLLRQTKLVLELNDPEELLQIAEVVKENVNIPAPPWALN